MMMVVVFVLDVVIMKSFLCSVYGCFISLISDDIDLVQRYDMHLFGYNKTVYMVDHSSYSSTILSAFVGGVVFFSNH